MDSEGKSYVFVKDPSEIYRAVEIVSNNFEKGELQVVDIGDSKSTRKTFKSIDTYPIASLDELFNPPSDLIKLRTVNLPCILNALKRRFEKDIIYTSVGPILVALNPFKWIQGIYDESVINKYHSATTDLSSDPHVFAISAEAFEGLKSNDNQSLIISGESGAGKTETTKQCLNYLAKIAGSASGVQNKILLASPILEAWGNAKTLRNNNSSRFGKFIEIWFDRDLKIVGAINTTYLLEKSRVVFQEHGERNYHVFYQLLRGGDTSLIQSLRLIGMRTDPKSVCYINQSGCIDIDDVDDGRDYNEVQSALLTVGFSSEECFQLWTIVAIVLHLGNVEFVPSTTNSDETTISDATMMHLDAAITFMGVDGFTITQALLKRKIQTGGKRNSISFSPYSVAQAIDNRNSLVKEIYNRTFDWIVTKINSFVNTSSTSLRRGMIGVLDIFGFEIFRKNSFEQLCINLANEALQQHFNFHIFRAELDLYRNEEIPVPDLTYNDNQDVLDLIVKKPNGIIPILDEEGLVPKGSWEGFLNKLIKIHHPSNKRFKNKHTTREFSVLHYAGEVTYDPKLFLAKNKDTLAQEIIEEMSESRMDLIRYIFRMVDTVEDSQLSGRVESISNKRSSLSSSSNKTTIGRKFTLQLESLVMNLNSTKPHYIRCIKPNDLKRPNIFLASLTNEQLTYSGVFEAVIILQSGYPFRLSLFDFRERYHMLVLDKQGREDIFGPPSPTYKRPQLSTVNTSELMKMCQNLVSLGIRKGHSLLKESYIGKSKVFYRAPVHYYLNQVRNRIMNHGISTIQRYARGYVFRKLYKIFDHLSKNCTKAIFSRDMKGMKYLAGELDSVVLRYNKCTPNDVSIKSIESSVALALHEAMLVDVEVVERLKSLLSDKSKVFESFDEIIGALMKAKRVISFKGTLKGVEISHTWQQNAFLVEANEKISSWERMVNRKKDIIRGISENDEVLLERINDELSELKKNGELDGVIDISDVLSPMIQVINASKKICETFLNHVYETYCSGKFQITGTEADGVSLAYTVNYEDLNQSLQQYIGVQKMQSIRVKVIVQSFTNIIHIRTLAKTRSWNFLWELLRLYECILNLPENVWKDTLHFSSPQSTDQEANHSYNQLKKLSPISAEEWSYLPSQIISDISEEIMDMARLCFLKLHFPKMIDSLARNRIPDQLYLNPNDSGVTLDELTKVLGDFEAFRSIFNPHIKKLINRGSEYLVLRSSFMSGNGIEIMNTIRGVSSIPSNDSDLINATKYANLYTYYNLAKESVYQDGILRWGKEPGFVEFLCNPSSLERAIEQLCDQVVTHSLWQHFIDVIKLLYEVRRDCLQNLFEKSVKSIDAVKELLWWNEVLKLGNFATSNFEDASIQDVICYATNEIEVTYLELRHRLAVSNLSLRCAQGGILGTLASLDYSKIEIVSLQAALSKYRNDIILTTTDARIIADCELLIDIRGKLIAEEWEVVGETIVEYYRSSNAFSLCHKATRQEFILCYHGYLDREAYILLLASIESNMIRLNENNEIDTKASLVEPEGVVSLSLGDETLSNSIKVAENLEFRSNKCQNLLDSIKMLQILRVSVRYDMWERWNLRRPREDQLSTARMTEDLLKFTFTDPEAENIVKELLRNSTKPSAIKLGESSIEEILAYCTSTDWLSRINMYESVWLEFQNAATALLERRMRTILIVSALSGQVTTTLGSIDASKVSYKLLARVLWNIRTLKSPTSAFKPFVENISFSLSTIIKNWLNAAENLLHLRIAIISAVSYSTDKISLQEYVDIQSYQDLLLNLDPGFPSQEMETIIVAINNLRCVDVLLKEFSQGRPSIFNGEFVVQSVNFDHMRMAITHIKKSMKNRSDKLDRLMFFADLSVHLRRSLMNKRWDSYSNPLGYSNGSGIESSSVLLSAAGPANLQSVKQCLEEYKRALKFFTSPIEGVPPRQLIEDIKIIEIEYERRNLINSFPAVFRTGRIIGQPLHLKLHRVSCDLLSSHIDRVKAWQVKNDNADPSLSLLVNAAEEIRLIRSEAIQLNSNFCKNRSTNLAENTANSGEDMLSGISLVQSISRNVTEDVVRQATSAVNVLMNRDGYIVRDWIKLEKLLINMTHCHAVSSLESELSLLTAETFSRSFIKQMTDIFYSVNKFYIFDRLRSLDAKFAHEAMKSIRDYCGTFSLRVQSVLESSKSENGQLVGMSVIQVIYHSAVILYHVLNANMIASYEPPHRLWGDVTTNVPRRQSFNTRELIIPSINDLTSNLHNETSPIIYSMQAILRVQKVNPTMYLHESVVNILRVHESFIEDMVSHEEMSKLSDYTKSFIRHGDSLQIADTKELILTDLIDLDPLYTVKERIQRIGIREVGIVAMFKSFQFFITILEYLKDGKYLDAYLAFDNLLCHGNKDFFDILRIYSQTKFSIPVHSCFQPAFEVCLRFTIDGYNCLLAEEALMDGFVDGQRFNLDISRVGYRKLDLFNRHAEFIFPWSIDSKTLQAICNAVYSYRKAVVSLEVGAVFSVLETVEPLEGFEDISSTPDAPINQSTDDLRRLEYIMQAASNLVTVLKTSNFIFKNVNIFPKLLNEANLVAEHAKAMMAMTQLFLSSSLRLIEWNESGLFAHIPILSIWKSDIIEVNQCLLNPYAVTDAKYAAFSKYITEMVNMVTAIEKVCNIESDRQITIDLESLSLDQRLNFDDREIESMLMDVTSSRSTVKLEPQITGNSGMITIRNDFVYIYPGSKSFEKTIPTIENCIDAYNSLSAQYNISNSKIGDNLESMNDALLAAMAEHRMIADIEFILKCHQISATTTLDQSVLDTGDYGIYVVDSRGYADQITEICALIRGKVKTVECNSLTDTILDIQSTRKHSFVASTSEDIHDTEYESVLDNESDDFSFPWLNSWLSTGNEDVVDKGTSMDCIESALSSAAFQPIYKEFSKYLKNLRLQSTFGNLFRVVTRLFIELRLCTVREEWSRGQVISYLLTHMTLSKDLDIPDAVNYREYVDVLTLKRRLEYGIYLSIFPPIIGWSMTTQPSGSLQYIDLKDVSLQETLSDIDVNYTELCNRHKLLFPLMTIGNIVLKIACALRKNRWSLYEVDGDIDTQGISTDDYWIRIDKLSDETNSQHLLEYRRFFDSNYHEGSIISHLSDAQDMILSNGNEWRPQLKSFLSIQITNIQREYYHRTIMSQILSIPFTFTIAGKPGQLKISKTSLSTLESYVEILSKTEACDIISNSIELLQMKQSFRIMISLIRAMETNQTSDEVQFIIAILKYMASLKDFYIFETNHCIASKFSYMNSDTLRSKKDKELKDIYELTCSTIDHLSNHFIEDYLRECKAGNQVLIDSINSSPFRASSITGGYEISSLVRLRPDFMSILPLIEKNFLLVRIREKFVSAIRSGEAKGVPGELDTSAVVYEEFGLICSELLSYGFISKEDLFDNHGDYEILLYRASYLLKQLRIAQVCNSLSNINETISDLDKAVIAERKWIHDHTSSVDDDGGSEHLSVDYITFNPAVSYECLILEDVQRQINLARDDWAQQHFLNKVLSSLHSPGISQIAVTDDRGLPTSMYLSEISVDDLLLVIKLSEDVQLGSQHSINCLESAKFLLSIRKAFKAKHWKEVIELVDGYDQSFLVGHVLPEITCARQSARTYSAVMMANEAYATGGFQYSSKNQSDSVNEDLLCNVDVDIVSNAYDQLSNIPENWRTETIQRHLDSCRNLRFIRQQVREKNWSAAHNIASLVVHPNRLEVKKTYGEVVAEVSKVIEYAAEGIAQNALRQTIYFGKSEGEPGRLVLTSLCFTHILSAINLTNELKAKSKLTTKLMNTVKLALRLRLAQSRDNWLTKTDRHCNRSIENAKKPKSQEKILPVEVEQAIIRYGRMTVEAAILEAETCLTLRKIDVSNLMTSASNSSKLDTGSPKASLMKVMFTQKSTNISPSGTEANQPSSNVALHSCYPPPNWMEAITFLPNENELISNSPILTEYMKKNESVEDILFEIEQNSSVSLAADLYDEIALSRNEIIYRRIVFSLLVGLRSKGPTGLPGALDVSTINTTTLNQVIAYAEQYSALSSRGRCKYLLRDAKLLLTARLKRIQREWKKLKSAVNTVKELNNVATCPQCSTDETGISEQINSGRTGYRGSNAQQAPLAVYHPIFQPVWEEFRVYDADLSFQLCLAAFAEEMNSKVEYASPSVGAAVDMTPILPLIDLTRKTRAAALIYPSNEFDRLIEAMNLAIELALRRVYEPNKSTKDLMDKTMAIRARDARMQLPSFASLLLNDVTIMSSATDKQQQIQALELAIVTGQQYIRSPIGRLNPKEIDNSTLQIIIQTSSPLLKTIGTKSDLHLIDVAIAVISVRKAVSAENWMSVKKILQENMSTLQSSSLVKDEINRVVIEADNYIMTQAISEVLQKGRYTDVVKIAKLIYRPKRKRLQSVIDSSYLMPKNMLVTNMNKSNNRVSFAENTTEVIEESGESQESIGGDVDIANEEMPFYDDDDDDNIESIKIRNRSQSAESFRSALIELHNLVEDIRQLKIRSDETNKYLKAGELILRMRNGLMNGLWDEVKNIVFIDASDGLLPAVVMEEIRAVRHGLRYRDVITKIADGMLYGAVGGTPGEVDLHTLDFGLLQEALIESGLEDLHDTNDAMKIMHDFAQKLCNVRRAIKEGRWDPPKNRKPDYDTTSRSLLLATSVKNIFERPLSSGESILSIHEAVEEFMLYETMFLPELKRLLQISDDEDAGSDFDGRENDSDLDEKKDEFPYDQVGTRVPFSSFGEINKMKIQYPIAKETDWLVHQWEAVKAAGHEVRLIQWEIKERSLRERLIEATEDIPGPVLRFTTSSQPYGSSFQDNQMNKSQYQQSQRYKNTNTRDTVSKSQSIDSVFSFSSSPDEDPLLIESLQLIIDEIKSQYADAEVMSEEIMLLLSTADMIVKFRQAIKSGVDLTEYKLLVEEALEMRNKGQISESVGVIELRAYMSASMTVEIIRKELIKTLTSGKVSGYLDDLKISDIEIKSLSYWLSSGRILVESAQELAFGLINIMKEADILLRVRTAVKLNQWSSLLSLWKNLFNNQGKLRDSVYFQYITNEVIHVYTASRLKESVKELQSILDESFDLDLENKFSLLMVKVVHLGSVLSQLKQLLAYTSIELIPQPVDEAINDHSFRRGIMNTETGTKSKHNSIVLPVHPSNAAIHLYQCGQVTMSFWSAICHKQWGDELLASGDLDNLPTPTDSLLHAVTRRFVQENLSSTAIQTVTMTSIKKYTSRPSILKVSLSSAQEFIDSFLEDGSTTDKLLFPTISSLKHSEQQNIIQSKPFQTTLKRVDMLMKNDSKEISVNAKISARRVSMTTSNQPDVMKLNESEPSALSRESASSGKGRRRSVAEALKETRRKSLLNPKYQNTILHQNRSNSIYNSIETSTVSVLEVLMMTDWSKYPYHLRRQFDSARNIVIDRALRLRLISCCTIGEVTTDGIGNIVVPDLNDSLELLLLSMTDESFIMEIASEAYSSGCCVVSLQWSHETTKWIRTAKILLSCRSAIVDYRIDDLVTELLTAGLGNDNLGYHEISADFICEAALSELKIMEQFALENVTETSLAECIQYVISVASNQLVTSGRVNIDSSIFNDPIIKKISELREHMYKRRDVTKYYQSIVQFAGYFYSALQGAVMGNQYQVLRSRDQMLRLSIQPPYILKEQCDDIDEVIELLLQRAIISSRSQLIGSLTVQSMNTQSSMMDSRLSVGSSVLPSTEDLYPMDVGSFKTSSQYKQVDSTEIGPSQEYDRFPKRFPKKVSLTQELGERLGYRRSSETARLHANLFTAFTSSPPMLEPKRLIYDSLIKSHESVSITNQAIVSTEHDRRSISSTIEEGNEPHSQETIAIANPSETQNLPAPFTNSVLRSLFGSI